MAKKITRKDKVNRSQLVDQAETVLRSEKETPQYLIPNTEQKKVVHSIYNKSITLITGSPGTGKTLFSIQTLYRLYQQGQINGIIIARLIHESEKEKIGALPGELDDKLHHRLLSVIDNLEQFLSPHKVEALIRDGVIKILPILYLQGRTFHNKGVIVEEAQNLDEDDIFMVLTRLGEGSKLVLNGDDKQKIVNRGKRRGGMSYLGALLENLDDDIGVVNLPDSLIERHPLIEKIVSRSYELKAA